MILAMVQAGCLTFTISPECGSTTTRDRGRFVPAVRRGLATSCSRAGSEALDVVSAAISGEVFGAVMGAVLGCSTG